MSELGYADTIINPKELSKNKILVCQLNYIDADNLIIWAKTHEERSTKRVVYIDYMASHGNEREEEN